MRPGQVKFTDTPELPMWAHASRKPLPGHLARLRKVDVAALGAARAGSGKDNRVMAAGGAQRVWFREMVETLRDEWHPGMLFEAIISLREDLDTTLQRIRFERNISSPVFRCRHCGHVGPDATFRVSVRAMILSLARLGIAPAHQIHDLEKRWEAYRKQNDLDALRQTNAFAARGEFPVCHPDTR